jgi:putative flippase GtrA
MNYSEIISISVSVISIIIALIALFQTNRQISLSNKQQLFDRRLSRYLEFNTIYSLYTANKL